MTVVGNLFADAEVKNFGDQKFIAFKMADNVYQGQDGQILQEGCSSYSYWSSKG